MLTPILSSKFKKDIRRMKRRGNDMDILRALLVLLVNETPLPEACQAHPLKGSWLPFWDAHLRDET